MKGLISDTYLPILQVSVRDPKEGLMVSELIICKNIKTGEIIIPKRINPELKLYAEALKEKYESL